MKRWRQVAAMVVAGMLSVSTAFSAVAAEKPADMDDATWTRLLDNKLEYDEIENLVIHYNPYYAQAAGAINVQLAPLEDAVESMREEVRELRADASVAKEDGDMYTYYMNTAVAKTMEEQVVKPLKKGLSSANASTKTIKNQVRRTMTSTVQQLMIGYHQALASQELLNASVEYAQAAYQSALAKQTLGMATAADVQNAELALLSAKGQQNSISDTLTTLRQNLCVMTGWAYTANPEIGAVPAPDLARIDTMNPDVDITMAISYNPTIIEQRAVSGKGEANHNKKFRSLDETEAKIKTQLEVLYQAVIQAKITYDGALSSCQNAQIIYDSSNRMYEQGMVSRLDYLQMRMGYLQQKMVYDQAVLGLTQAMENYEWALYGVITLD